MQNHRKKRISETVLIGFLKKIRRILSIFKVRKKLLLGISCILLAQKVKIHLKNNYISSFQIVSHSNEFQVEVFGGII